MRVRLAYSLGKDLLYVNGEVVLCVYRCVRRRNSLEIGLTSRLVCFVVFYC